MGPAQSLTSSPFHPRDRSAPAFPTRFDPCRPTLSAPDCLSWGCQSTPLHRLGAGESTPCRRCRHRCHAEPGCQPDSVPPSWFSTTATVSSSSTLPGCCTRLPVLGFAAFRPAANRLPRDAFLPSRALLRDCSGATDPERSTPRGILTAPHPMSPSDRAFTGSLASSPSSDVHLAMATGPTSRLSSASTAGARFSRCRDPRAHCSPGLDPPRRVRCRTGPVSPPAHAPVSQRAS